MSFYRSNILPWLVEKGCGVDVLSAKRQEIVPLASGTVLDLGIGTGLNCQFLDKTKIDRLIGVDPCANSLVMAAKAAARHQLPLEAIRCGGEAMPIADASVDTVLLTYTLCTVPDLDAVLREIDRVLRPAGRILFLEHVCAPTARLNRWQGRLQGVWGRLFGGCQLRRDPQKAFVAAGYSMDHFLQEKVPGTLPPMAWQQTGIASKSA